MLFLDNHPISGDWLTVTSLAAVSVRIAIDQPLFRELVELLLLLVGEDVLDFHGGNRRKCPACTAGALVLYRNELLPFEALVLQSAAEVFFLAPTAHFVMAPCGLVTSLNLGKNGR